MAYDLIIYPATVGTAPANLLSLLTGGSAVSTRRAIRSAMHLIGYGLHVGYPDLTADENDPRSKVSLLEYPASLADAPKALIASGLSGSWYSTTAVRAAFHLPCYGLGILYPDVDTVPATFATATNDDDTIMDDDVLLSHLESLESGKVASFGLFPFRSMLITLLSKMQAFAYSQGYSTPLHEDVLKSYLKSMEAGENVSAFPWMQIIITLLPLIQEWIRNR